MLEENIREIKSFLKLKGFWKKEGSVSIKEAEYLLEATKRFNAKIIGETGFNRGFSTLAFLDANPDVKVFSFDIGEYQYIPVVKQFIDKKFPGRHTLITGDSKETLTEFKKNNPDILFDLVFIDGGHDYKTVKADIINMKLLCHKNAYVIIDDLTPWMPWGIGPTIAWKKAISRGIIEQKEMYKNGKSISRIRPFGERIWALGRYL